MRLVSWRQERTLEETQLMLHLQAWMQVLYIVHTQLDPPALQGSRWFFLVFCGSKHMLMFSILEFDNMQLDPNLVQLSPPDLLACIAEMLTQPLFIPFGFFCTLGVCVCTWSKTMLQCSHCRQQLASPQILTTTFCAENTCDALQMATRLALAAS